MQHEVKVEEEFEPKVQSQAKVEVFDNVGVEDYGEDAPNVEFTKGDMSLKKVVMTIV